GFSRVMASIGRRAVPSPLKKDADGVWRMDFADMEEKIKENHLHFAIFCSPHNPTGRVWERGEIEDFMALCRKYDLIVFSDGIWNDILLHHHEYVPTHSVSDDARMRTISVCAPSKTFSLAGLVGSYHFVCNETLADKLKKASESTHYNNRNVLSDAALVGAYSPEGAAWADELCKVLSANVDYAYRHITEKYSGISLAKPQGTYMLYPDLTEYLEKTGKTLTDVLIAGWRVGVIWQDGTPFGMENTLRINLALPTEKVKEAFDRLDKFVF
ncbi:MAG: aminotransferase class I/II-fold pyridoxal phosphate-dependent enzyme, partial [Ruminococcus sp.]|nr:aminotransferase class I/II-fold pyridoxal phosphate-dependent enzyme [Candidatus Apopatosoma intestinale]